MFCLWKRKKPYSIWKKLEIQHKSLEQLSDIFGFRVCVDSISECYQVLGILHGEWQAIPGKFKDYISTPKKWLPISSYNLNRTTKSES